MTPPFSRSPGAWFSGACSQAKARRGRRPSCPRRGRGAQPALVAAALALALPVWACNDAEPSGLTGAPSAREPLGADAPGGGSDPVGPTEPPGGGSAPAGPSATERGPLARSAALGQYFPDRLGVFGSSTDARPAVAIVSGQPLVSAERQYEAGGRELTLRIVEVTDASALRTSFAVARELTVEALDDITRQTLVAHEPGLVQWSRATAESEAQVLVGGRYLVSLRVWPADRPDEAHALLPEALVRELARP